MLNGVQDALAAGLAVNVSFEEQMVPGYFAAVDTDNRLQQLGWQRQPTLMHLAWAAQWLHYAANLSERLQEPALVVPVFERQVCLLSAASYCQVYAYLCMCANQKPSAEHSCGVYQVSQ